MSTPAPTATSTQAAAHTAAWYRVAQPGALLLGGATRTDYVQRQTTNDVGLLSPQRAVPTVLTNPSARILEVFTLLQHGEHFLLLTQPGHAPGLAAYFKRHLFFNDQVTLEDASPAWTQFELYGPQVRSALASLGFAQQPNALDEVVTATWQDHTLYAIQDEGYIRVLLPSALGEALPAEWTTIAELDLAARELLRIEAGRAGDPEFTDANTPFEVGLGRYVSASKGCYTGQEVLARQVTYDKVARGLAQLSPAQAVQPGASVSLDGRTIGQVSSAAVSPAHGPLALAVLRKPFEQGDQVTVNGKPATIR